jgi:hypothetical protein
LIGDAGDSKGEFIKSISRLELKGRRVDEDGVSLFGEIWITYDHLDSFHDQVNGEKTVDPDRTDYDEFSLREAYATASLGQVDLKAGKAILGWARTDEISPIDIINPEDFREFLTIDRIERKIPALLLDGMFNMDDFALEAVWLPFFEPAIVPSRGIWTPRLMKRFQNILPPEQYANLDFEADKDDISESEIAVRFTGSSGPFDFGLLYFNGHDDFPNIQIDLDDQGQITSTVVYPRFNGYGFDFAYLLSGYGLRGEVLYRDKILYPLRTLVEGQINRESPDIRSVFGIDRTYGETFYVNAQLVFNKILDYTDDIILDENTFFGTLNIEDKFLDDELKLALQVFYGFNQNDWMIRPYLVYSITDNLKAEFGTYLFSGPEDSEFGQFDDNDMVYLRITYAF